MPCTPCALVATQWLQRQLVWAILNQLSSAVMQLFPMAVRIMPPNFVSLELCVACHFGSCRSMHTSRFFQLCKGHNHENKFVMPNLWGHFGLWSLGRQDVQNMLVACASSLVDYILHHILMIRKTLFLFYAISTTLYWEFQTEVLLIKAFFEPKKCTTFNMFPKYSNPLDGSFPMKSHRWSGSYWLSNA